MITTIIPYFLLASVPKDAIWQNGPEYKFSLLTNVKMSGFNGTMIYGVNGTNEMMCRPQEENGMKCKLVPVKYIVYKINLDTGDIDTRERGREFNENVEPFIFEIKFDDKGVHSIVLNETASKDERKDIMKYLASTLNVGVDLADFHAKQDGDLTKLNQTNNFLIGKCMANLEMGYSIENTEAKEGNWNLDLVSPLDKLSGRGFHIAKSWDPTKCSSLKKLVLSGMIMETLAVEDLFNVVNFDGKMSVYRDKFESKIEQYVEGSFEDKNVTSFEGIYLNLDDIYSAEKEWPAIKNPVTIMVNDN